MTKKLFAASLGAALTAAIALAALPAHADEGVTDTGTSDKRLVYIPHKSGYPFNFVHVPNERAEFARVEVDPNSRPKRMVPPTKAGHPINIRN